MLSDHPNLILVFISEEVKGFGLDLLLLVGEAIGDGAVAGEGGLQRQFDRLQGEAVAEAGGPCWGGRSRQGLGLSGLRLLYWVVFEVQYLFH